MPNLNHCEQIQILDGLLRGFYSSKFDNIINLDKEVSKLTAEAFYEQVLKPRLDELKETGERMETGLFRRKTVMELTNLSPTENLEEKYQKIKKLKT
jgi:hypothetical protein